MLQWFEKYLVTLFYFTFINLMPNNGSLSSSSFHLTAQPEQISNPLSFSLFDIHLPYQIWCLPGVD